MFYLGIFYDILVYRACKSMFTISLLCCPHWHNNNYMLMFISVSMEGIYSLFGAFGFNYRCQLTKTKCNITMDCA